LLQACQNKASCVLNYVSKNDLGTYITGFNYRFCGVVA